MTQKYEIRTKQTIDTINHLLDNGITKISALIRHSDRFFTKDPKLEPFMGLTDTGKAAAVNFGAAIQSTLLPKLTSSFIGRCIETAYLIDKGYTRKHDRIIDHNALSDMLSPFYVKDPQKAIPYIENQGNAVFLRNWFDNRFDESIMENPERTSDFLSKFMIEQIKNLKENQIAICISHDWNIYPLKEFKLGLKLETAGDVGYFDGVIFFEKDHQYYITNYQTSPVLL
ncbi:MAG: histidine phosphatase family protein [Deltaproteobacteria bacterium]|nr:histidine phosphatase family protein [Deltaproteobacteria bacterium]